MSARSMKGGKMTMTECEGWEDNEIEVAMRVDTMCMWRAYLSWVGSAWLTPYPESRTIPTVRPLA